MKLLGNNNKQSGIALIIVMLVVLVLGVLAAGFAASMKVEMRLAQQSNLDAAFEALGRSGVDKAKLLLAESFKGKGGGALPIDSLKQRWAGGPGDGSDTNATAETSLDAEELMEGEGSFKISIVDAERKCNINKVQGNMQQILQQAMLLIGVDAGTSPTVVDSILDWIDRDNDEHTSGAENSYYSRLDPPYMCKNGPIDDMTEMLLIKGIDTDPAIFYGTSSNRNASSFGVQDGNAFSREEPPKDYRMGLTNLFTTISLGTINVNTATPEVLQLIPGIDEATAQQIVGAFPGRAGPDGTDGTEDDTPFQNIGDLNGRNIPGMPTGPQVTQMLNQYCGVRSRIFEVHVECTIAGITREYIALLDRPGPQVKTLYMYWKSNSAGKERTVGPTLSDNPEQ